MPACGIDEANRGGTPTGTLAAVRAWVRERVGDQFGSELVGVGGGVHACEHGAAAGTRHEPWWEVKLSGPGGRSASPSGVGQGRPGRFRFYFPAPADNQTSARHRPSLTNRPGSLNQSASATGIALSRVIRLPLQKSRESERSESSQARSTPVGRGEAG